MRQKKSNMPNNQQNEESEPNTYEYLLREDSCRFRMIG
jgi:hypothetical protein